MTKLIAPKEHRLFPTLKHIFRRDDVFNEAMRYAANTKNLQDLYNLIKFMQDNPLGESRYSSGVVKLYKTKTVHNLNFVFSIDGSNINTSCTLVMNAEDDTFKGLRELLATLVTTSRHIFKLLPKCEETKLRLAIRRSNVWSVCSGKSVPRQTYYYTLMTLEDV